MILGGLELYPATGRKRDKRHEIWSVYFRVATGGEGENVKKISALLDTPSPHRRMGFPG
jgi:hypothetical protein